MNQYLLAVLFDKGCDFCVMKETTNTDNPNAILSANRFEACYGGSDHLTVKTQKQIKIKFHRLMKQGKIRKNINYRLRTTGWQKARLLWTC